MEKDGVLKNHEPDYRGNPDLWSLPGRKQPINWYSRKHEIDAADLFVALARTGKLQHWDVGWADTESHFAQHRVNYDRRAEIEGVRHVVFFEVDRGTEDLDTIRRKVDKYIGLQTAYPDEHFMVLFTVQGYRWTDARSRCDDINKVLHSVKRGNQFLTTPHIAFIADPLGEVVIPPHHPDRLLRLTTV